MKPALGISLEEFFPHSITKVWRGLTGSQLLTRWLMPNDFKPELGHRFTFRTEPIPSVGFDGTIHCQVLAIEPPRLLQISWRGGHGLNSTLTWRLEPEGSGTRLFLEHTGFDPEDAVLRQAHKMMDSGWRSHILRRDRRAALRAGDRRRKAMPASCVTEEGRWSTARRRPAVAPGGERREDRH